jgi:hypothetical protein
MKRRITPRRALSVLTQALALLAVLTGVVALWKM